jgi:hypothetical protein
MELDGCFPEASEVFTEEEYFSKVGFSEDLLPTFDLYEEEGTYYWPINSRQGYIQKGRFRPPNPEKEVRLEWAIIYECQLTRDFLFFATLICHCTTDKVALQTHLRRLSFKRNRRTRPIVSSWDRNRHQVHGPPAAYSLLCPR